MRKLLNIAAALFIVMTASLLPTAAMAYVADSGAYHARERQVRQALDLIRKESETNAYKHSQPLFEDDQLVLSRTEGLPDPWITTVEVQFKSTLPYIGDVLHVLGMPAYFRRSQHQQPTSATLYYPALHLAVYVNGPHALSPTGRVVAIVFIDLIQPDGAFLNSCQPWAGFADL